MENSRLQTDCRVLSSIFPELIWYLLCDEFIQFPDTIERMFHASVYLRQLLYPFRNKFLFTRVTPRIKKVYTYGIFSGDISQADRVLLKLRSVCSSWCQTIDRDVALMFRSSNYSGFTQAAITRTEWNGDRETEYMSYFEERHYKHRRNKCPFIGNAAVLTFDHPNVDTDGARIPFQKLLPAFGHHVKQCVLKFFCNPVNEEWFQAALLRILMFLPNVSCLAIDCFYANLLSSSNSINLQFELPKFVYLRDITIVLQSGNRELTNTLLSRMPNLRSIRFMVREQALSPKQNLLPGASLSKLERLDLHLVPPLLAVPEFAENHPTLLHHECTQDAGLHAIFRTLELYSPLQNLHTLIVGVGCTLPPTWQKWKYYQIDLPHLTKFLLCSNSWPSIDMVLLFRGSLEDFGLQVNPLETLEEWNRLEGAAEFREQEQIKFLSRNGVLDKESNIWTEMPKLSFISLVIGLPGQNETKTRFYRDYAA